MDIIHIHNSENASTVGVTHEGITYLLRYNLRIFSRI